MRHEAKVAIDHATIYCKNQKALTQLLASLGFYSQNEAHYMLRNSYFEFYQPHSEEETYSFFPSEAGLHSFIFWSDDIDNCYDRLLAAGYETQMVTSNFSRPADHGEPRGEAAFRGFYMQTPVLPIGETAVVQQMTPELIYPEKPYLHPNTAYAMKTFYLCVEKEEEKRSAAQAMERICSVIGEGRPERDCINELIVDDAAAYAKEFGVTVDPARSCCTGIHFLVKDLAAAEDFAAKAGVVFHKKDGVLCVDLHEEMNLFFLFSEA